PLVLAWIALWWKLFGYSPAVTRAAMVVIASFSLTGVFRPAEQVANAEVAVAATVCTGLYPVFFAQSSLAQVDLAAAGLTVWRLPAYLRRSRAATVIWFSLAVLAKETAVLAPLALAAGELVSRVAAKSARLKKWGLDREPQREARDVFPLLAPVLPL